MFFDVTFRMSWAGNDMNDSEVTWENWAEENWNSSRDLCFWVNDADCREGSYRSSAFPPHATSPPTFSSSVCTLHSRSACHPPVVFLDVHLRTLAHCIEMHKCASDWSITEPNDLLHPTVPDEGKCFVSLLEHLWNVWGCSSFNFLLRGSIG